MCFYSLSKISSEKISCEPINNILIYFPNRNKMRNIALRSIVSVRWRLGSLGDGRINDSVRLCWGFEFGFEFSKESRLVRFMSPVLLTMDFVSWIFIWIWVTDSALAICIYFYLDFEIIHGQFLYVGRSWSNLFLFNIPTHFL